MRGDMTGLFGPPKGWGRGLRDRFLGLSDFSRQCLPGWFHSISFYGSVKFFDAQSVKGNVGPARARHIPAGIV